MNMREYHHIHIEQSKQASYYSGATGRYPFDRDQLAEMPGAGVGAGDCGTLISPLIKSWIDDSSESTRADIWDTE